MHRFLAIVGFLTWTVLACTGCGADYLSDDTARSPSIAAAKAALSGAARAPIAAVWAERVPEQEMAVVGRVFDEPVSASADAAPREILSAPIPFDELRPPAVCDPKAVLAGTLVARISGNDLEKDGLFVAWIEKNGPQRGRFTDLELMPVSSPITIAPMVLEPAPAQGRRRMWAFYKVGKDRIVVVWHGRPDTEKAAGIQYAAIDPETMAVLTQSVLPLTLLGPDISSSSDPSIVAPLMIS